MPREDRRSPDQGAVGSPPDVWRYELDAGRSINDSMPGHVARMAIMGLNDVGKVIWGSNVLIIGLTYNEDMPDIRDLSVFKIVREGIESV